MPLHRNLAGQTINRADEGVKFLMRALETVLLDVHWRASRPTCRILPPNSARRVSEIAHPYGKMARDGAFGTPAFSSCREIQRERRCRA
jgi:hypothetical protein